MNGSLLRRLLAELLGTALLAFFGPGAVVAALTMGKGSLDYAGLGIVALSFGLVVALVIYALGTISGAHINPAVTVALAVTRRFWWAEVPAYVGAQARGRRGWRFPGGRSGRDEGGYRRRGRSDLDCAGCQFRTGGVG
jgi:glycerol uptake facilitator protein